MNPARLLTIVVCLALGCSHSRAASQAIFHWEERGPALAGEAHVTVLHLDRFGVQLTDEDYDDRVLRWRESGASAARWLSRLSGLRSELTELLDTPMDEQPQSQYRPASVRLAWRLGGGALSTWEGPLNRLPVGVRDFGAAALRWTRTLELLEVDPGQRPAEYLLRCMPLGSGDVDWMGAAGLLRELDDQELRASPLLRSALDAPGRLFASAPGDHALRPWIDPVVPRRSTLEVRTSTGAFQVRTHGHAVAPQEPRFSR